MHSVIGIAAILFVVCIQGDGQQITATSCGQRLSEPIPLMIDAFNASHYPWHAAIYHKDDQFVPQYKCGGTLIDSLSILTAAHCVSRYNQPMDAAKIFVSLGRLNLGVNESSSQSFVVIFYLVAVHHAPNNLNASHDLPGWANFFTLELQRNWL